jgi:hypothetical protein
MCATNPPAATPMPESVLVEAHDHPVTPQHGTPEFVSLPMASPDIDDEAKDAPLRFRRMDNVLGPTPLPGLVDKEFMVELLATIGDELATAEEALRDERWHQAMLDELGSIRENRTWTLVDLPKGHKPIGVKWVFKLKRDELGQVVKHKARLVAKGYAQMQGIDFEEVFAPIARMESVRVLLCLVAQFNWTLHHMDVKCAFLNGELTEEVYVSQPPSFIKKGQEGKVLRLHKALYGLRQASRA